MNRGRHRHENSHHTRIASGSTASYGTISSRPSEDAVDFVIDPNSYHGRPQVKRRIEVLDVMTLSTSFLCLAVSIWVIKRHELFHYYLTYPDEVIAIVTLLGVENQCMMGLAKNLFLLLECRFGQSTLHNYEGIIQWSVFVPQQGWTWRLFIATLCVMPLVLNIIYNYFTGGSVTISFPQEHMICGPTTSSELGPISPKWFVPTGLSILATSAAPLLSQVVSDESSNISYPQPYGFNTLLLSNFSAAGLDAPLPEYVIRIQQDLSLSESVNLSATVRATIVTHNPIEEELRANEAYWQQFYRVQSLTRRNTDIWRNQYESFWVGMLNCGIAGSNEPDYWNGSWFFTSGYSVYDNITQNPKVTPNSTLVDQQHEKAFGQAALRFDAKRNLCNATWTITKTSVQLSQGACENDPLPYKYQWMQNVQTFMSANYWSLLYEYYRCFDLPDIQNCDTPWRINIQTATIALAYQATIAEQQGWVKLQPEGTIWNAWLDDPSVWQEPFWGDGSIYFERYSVSTIQQKTIPTLRDSWALIWTVAIMPTLTLIAFILTLCLHSVPIGPDFGILALLAGTNRFDLDILAGAAFSGQTTRKVYLQIRTVSQEFEQDTTGKDVSAIEYRLRVGERAPNDRLRQGVSYG